MITESALLGMSTARDAIAGLHPLEEIGSKHSPLISQLEAGLASVGIRDVSTIDGTVPTVSEFSGHQGLVEECVRLVRDYYRRLNSRPTYFID